MNIQTHIAAYSREFHIYAQTGFGCGYVGVDSSHPWFGKHYDNLDVDIHGGLTWSEAFKPNHKPDGLWWLGFDTAHSGDTLENCSEEYVKSQTQSLYNQAVKAWEDKQAKA